ncbi:MAG: hybrid sensor histidine kinase/response regulator [Myxococcaceae bacterium]
MEPRPLPDSASRAIDLMCLRYSMDGNAVRAVSTTLSGGTAVWALSFWVPVQPLLIWFALICLNNLARGGLWLWLRRPRSDDEIVRVVPLFTLTMGIASSLWGTLIVFAGWSTAVPVVAIISLIIAGMMSGGILSTSATPRIMYFSIGSSFLLMAIHLISSGDPVLRSFDILVLSHVMGMAAATRATYRGTRETFRLRFENADLIEQLKAEREAAERANQDKSRFVAAASHDARQPLHAMGLLIDTLKTRALPSRESRLVSSIDVAHASLVSLHEGLLELSVAEVGAVVPRIVETPLETVFDTLSTECGPRAKRKQLGLDFRGASLAVKSDPAMLLRVLRNLVSNAITYTEHGRVLVTARRRGERALIQVWDTGVGIAPEHREKIFDELYQVGNQARDRTQGLGLGLAIVKRLASALGTTVTVQSKPGRGSVFAVSLPLAERVAEKPVAAASGAVALVVDDDAMARQALAQMLQQWGYEVVTATDAEEAGTYVRELERLDLVVSDLWLPGQSGIELLVGMSGKSTKRVLMSGDTTPETERKVKTSGLTFVRKPVRGSTLAAALA